MTPTFSEERFFAGAYELVRFWITLGFSTDEQEAIKNPTRYPHVRNVLIPPHDTIEPFSSRRLAAQQWSAFFYGAIIISAH